jgi:DNA-binding NarL/FixJ family response regulator
MASLKLLVADDHELVRKGIRAIVAEQPGWEIVAEATTGREAVEKAKTARPDVVILDVSMPELNGMEAARQMLRNDVKCRILMLTVHESDQIVREAIVAGVRGYVMKSDANRDLVGAIDAVGRNRTYFTPRVEQMVLDGYLARKRKSVAIENWGQRLTGRQREIVQLLAEGRSSKEVAAYLNLSIKTAETHRANIMRRLDCHSISGLVLYAVRNNMVSP